MSKVLAAVLIAVPALADELLFELPVLESQSFAAGGDFPTWAQATSMSAMVVEFGHLGLVKGTESWPTPLRMGGRALGSALFNFFLVLLPPGQAWAHEEGHASAMAEVGIQSFNGVNDVGRDWGIGIPLYGMSDESIASAKAAFAPSWVRVQEAGWEAEQARLLRIERDTFLHPELGRLNVVPALLTKLSVIQYLAGCASDAFEISDEELAERDADAFTRDFAGPDCTGWVYDLFRPDEPYQARGPHPAGNGLRRIRRPSDLTDQERAYLHRQRNLSLLNLLDPNLFGFSGFGDTSGWRWNATVAHQLTSFGQAIDLNLFVHHGEVTAFATLTAYSNRHATFPGVRVDIERYPLGNFRLSGSTSLWVQPYGQRFDAPSGRPGFLVSASLDVPLGWKFEGRFSMMGKTEGWAPAEPSLDSAIEFGAGIVLVL